MSRIGMIGLGKLGLPVILAIESKGHEVWGYDVRDEPYGYLATRYLPFKEQGLQPLLDATKIHLTRNLADLVGTCDIVFAAPQTPHDAAYDGSSPMPDSRRDFDYSYLIQLIRDVRAIATAWERHVTLAVISTCLPGTFTREIEPLLNEYLSYCYVPQFIAMGQVVDDYLHPEFNLIGVHSPVAAKQLEAFYATINSAPCVTTDITTAEGIKVSYNTWITMKTVVANAWGELSERLGMNFDDLYKAWSLSTKRLISPAYMKAGMSDGGGCHPRDNIALSHIARRTGMSHDLWSDMMHARESTEAWHAGLAADAADEYDLPLVLLGKSFKPETDIQTGSPALLMAHFLEQEEYPYRHIGEHDEFDVTAPSVFFLATGHDVYKRLPYPKGSVVLDPFGLMPKRKGVTIRRIGRRDHEA